MINEAVCDLDKQGWAEFVKRRRGRGNFGSLQHIRHPARRILRQYSSRGVPVSLQSAPWSQAQLEQALQRGPHSSVHAFSSFLREEFADMIKKGQWVVLPFDKVKHLLGLCLSPPGCVPQRDRRPRWICDYSFYGVNDNTNPIVPLDSMQFGRALDRILRQILLADPSKGPVHMLKLDVSDGFYRIWLRLEDIPKLGVVFPSAPGEAPLVALPLVLPMGWKNSPPAFCTATETVADIANRQLRHFVHRRKHYHAFVPKHKYDALAETVKVEQASPLPSSILPPIPRDPHIKRKQWIMAFVDVYMDDFVQLVQGNHKDRSTARSILFHSLDKVFRPLDDNDPIFRREPLSLKKLKQGDCSWSTKKVVLGWLIDTINNTITLPEHRVLRLKEILDSIPPTQHRTTIDKWHRILGELRSMSIALPGARGLFSRLQHALSSSKKHRIRLSKGVHDDLHDFRLLHQSIATRPTRIAELVPLTPSIYGPHDASGLGAGGAIFPDGTLHPRFAAGNNSHSTPIVWRWKFPAAIIKELITSDNPNGSISISDLELAGELIEREAIVQNFDTRERTILTATDNSPTLFWSRKGSTTTTKAASALLRALAFHQRFHRYVPREDHISGVDNLPGDAASRLFHLSNQQLLSHFSTHFPQAQSWKLWTPPKPFLSAVTSALLNNKFNKESLLKEPKPTTTCGTIGPPTVQSWAWTPFSQISKTKSLSSKSTLPASAPVNWRHVGTNFAAAPLKVTYGRLGKRSALWGPRTHAKLGKEI